MFNPRPNSWLVHFLIASSVFFGCGIQAQAIISDAIIAEYSDAERTFPLVSQGNISPLFYDQREYPGVVRAVHDLQEDIHRVTDQRPSMSDAAPNGESCVVIGTLGKNVTIDQLVATGKLDVGDLEGKWECFMITTLENPFPGVDQALVIVGSDKRGTIYGIYELCEQLGVSPWHWWADVPAMRRNEAHVVRGRYVSREPKVRYRGIFINDENPCMQRWAREKFGGMNRQMYGHVFELLLRLRANCLWPGMWGSFKEDTPSPGKAVLYDEDGSYLGNSFNEDDPENPRLADEYGIVMGTSHHEPMQRSQQEWLRNREQYGNGEWNYSSNKAGILKFFREGIEHSKDYESLITIGMRGDDDMPMADLGSAEANFRLLETIMEDQRTIIDDVVGDTTSKLQQVWTLYSEVLDYYDKGMHVPDDVIIVLCDDNWGNVRRVPNPDQVKHPGGYGMYFHAGYYGAPRAYKWLNVTHLPSMWEQLQLTYDYGVDQLWILNVGALKPNEFPIDFFLKMAWDPEKFNEKNLMDYTENFCRTQFGESHATEAAFILNQFCKFSSRVTPEMLDEHTFDLQSGEFESVRNEFLALEARALRQFQKIPEASKDAYTQLILYPVQALANLYDLYYAVALNRRHLAEKNRMANLWANHAKACFDRDAELTREFHHSVASGKWNHMMAQTHIGYRTWHPPQGGNQMPEVGYLEPESAPGDAGGYVFREKQGVVCIEAEHYYQCENGESAQWTVIPDLGRTRSGITLMPYTGSVQDAEISYKARLKAPRDHIPVKLIFDCTMPFIEGGHHIAVRINDGKEQILNINRELVWDNKYTKMFPTAATRIIEMDAKLENPREDSRDCLLSIRPLDPGVVLQKIIIDCGGYEETFLKMRESPYRRLDG